MTMGRSRRRAEANIIAGLEAAIGRRPRAISVALPWRWRYELLLVIGVPLAATMIAHAIGPVQSLIGATILGFAIGFWSPSRRALMARAWCIITPHRVRVGCVQARIHSRYGRLPAIVRTSLEPFGERVRIWCVAGTSAEDFQSARSILRAACWATDVRVGRSARYAHLVTPDVIRCPASLPAADQVGPGDQGPW
jgi:hypothetical protein